MPPPPTQDVLPKATEVALPLMKPASTFAQATQPLGGRPQPHPRTEQPCFLRRFVNRGGPRKRRLRRLCPAPGDLPLPGQSNRIGQPVMSAAICAPSTKGRLSRGLGGERCWVRGLGSDRSAGRAGIGIDPYFQQRELPVAALLESFACKRRPGNVAAEPRITLCVAWLARSGPGQPEGPLKVPARWSRSLG